MEGEKITVQEDSVTEKNMAEEGHHKSGQDEWTRESPHQKRNVITKSPAIESTSLG